MCTINKSAHTKKCGNLFNDPRIYEIKLANLAVGEPKASFSIATTTRCRGGLYSIPWNVLLYS